MEAEATTQSLVSAVLLPKLRPLQGSADATPPEHLGGFFPRKHLTFCASKPGVGKTWFTLLNIRNITNDGEVCLLLNGESGFDVLSQRMSLLNWSIPKELCYVACLSDFNGNSLLCFDDPIGWRNVCAIVSSIRPAIIFVDSLMAFMSKDESDMKSMRDALGRLKMLAEKYECAVVMNHHLRKNAVVIESASIEDFIGSSIIGRYACCMYSLVNNAGVIDIRCVKSWYAPHPPVNFKLDFANGQVFFRNNLGVTLEVDNKASLRSLLIRHADEWFSVAQIRAMTKNTISTRTIQRLMARLLENGEVLVQTKEHNEKLYRIAGFKKVEGNITVRQNDSATGQAAELPSTTPPSPDSPPNGEAQSTP